MELYFENSRGDWRLIADCANKIDVGIAIRAFIDQANAARKDNVKFTVPYVRTWDSDGYRHYDVGSHTEFFHWHIGSDSNDYEGSNARL